MAFLQKFAVEIPPFLQIFCGNLTPQTVTHLPERIWLLTTVLTVEEEDHGLQRRLHPFAS